MVVVDEQAADDVVETIAALAAGQIDHDHVRVDVHGFDAAMGEEPARQLVGRTVAEDLLAGPIALVTHAGEAAIEIEAEDVATTSTFSRNSDWLPHGSGDHTAMTRNPLRTIS